MSRTLRFFSALVLLAALPVACKWFWNQDPACPNGEMNATGDGCKGMPPFHPMASAPSASSAPAASSAAPSATASASVVVVKPAVSAPASVTASAAPSASVKPAASAPAKK